MFFNATQKVPLKAPLDTVRTAFTKEVNESSFVQGKLLRKDRFQLKSKKQFQGGSWIVREHYTVKGHLAANDEQTLLYYKVKANGSFDIILLMGSILILPTFIIFYFIGAQGAENNWNVSPNNGAMAVVLLMMYLLAVFYFQRMKAKLVKEGKSDFKVFLKNLQERLA